jgi:hypothetical protein
MYTVKPFSGRHYHKNSVRTVDGCMACAICGKPVRINAQTVWAHVVDGGAVWADDPTAPAPTTPDFGKGDMGMFPVGNDCHNRYRVVGQPTSVELARTYADEVRDRPYVEEIWVSGILDPGRLNGVVRIWVVIKVDTTREQELDLYRAVSVLDRAYPGSPFIVHMMNPGNYPFPTRRALPISAIKVYPDA